MNDDIRVSHNLLKRKVISDTRDGDKCLDVGCGTGGDFKKWAHTRLSKLDMCDPIKESLDEAKTRIHTINNSPKLPGVRIDIRPRFYHGCILSCPNELYNVICYNYSLHYIFESREKFYNSITAICNRLAPGGRLVGIIPDSESIIMDTPMNDGINFVSRNESTTGKGQFGEKIFVSLGDTPFYKDGARAEPIAYKDILITELANRGLQLLLWKQCQGNKITSLYSQFIFEKVNTSSAR
jgi:SAM-dependent methyltransferase